MICPNCQHPNGETAKFCENCGFNLRAPLPQPTPAAVPEPDPALARLQKLVPQEFAKRLLESRSGRIEGERRIVTILFCDVKGSTALGEERDPEEILEIMNGAFDFLIEPVYRYEGTLARLMGDSVLAFFGAPIAHEDDPERACLAALAMQARIAEYGEELKRTHGIEQFTVRVGINTGLVVVGEVGSDLRVEYTAMGDTINVASRLENAAEPGTIVISENSARRVQHSIALEPLGALNLKGKSEPVNAFRVRGRLAEPTSARGIASLTSPLVGRAAQLAVLEHATAELRQGHGSIVSVIGEAGLGKSRLVAELKKSAVPSVAWLEGRSLSYETNTPNAPFVDMLSRLFELEPGDNDFEKYDKVCAQVNMLLPGHGDQVAPFIATLLGIELLGEPSDMVRFMMPPMLRGQIVQSLVEMVSAFTARAPTVMVFEDLHWADASSLELVSALAALATRLPLLVLLLFRPNTNDPAWQVHTAFAAQFGARYITVELEPLDAAHSRQLVANLLEIEDLPESVRALILAKAEGNPFYVEEVIRSLLDQKLVIREGDHWRATREITTIAIPDTLAGVITARLDRLDETARTTAQTAAVIGRDFQFQVLADVLEMPQFLEPSLDTLQARELVRQRMDEVSRAYLFKHALTQETAYSTLLKSKRTALHRRVGETLERLAPQSVDDIARHYSDAGENIRALPYLIAAGARAARAFSINEAIGYFNRAVATSTSGENIELARRSFEGLGSALASANQLEAALQTFREMFEWGKAHDSVPMQVSALNKTAEIAAMRMGQFPEAEAWLKQSENLALEANDRLGLAEGYTIRCQLCQAQADFAGTIRYMQESVAIGRELNIQAQTAFGLAHLAGAQMTMGDFEAAYETGKEALQVSLEIGDREHEGQMYVEGYGMYFFTQGDVSRGIEYMDRGNEISAKINATFNIIIGCYLRGWIAEQQGDYETALLTFNASRAAAAPLETAMPFMLVMPVAALVNAMFNVHGSMNDAMREDETDANAVLGEPTGIPGGGTAFADLGDVAFARGEFESARALYIKGLELPSFMRDIMRPRAMCGIAMTLLANGQVAQAADYVPQARDYAAAHGMKNFEPLIAFTAGQVAAAQGDSAGALREFTRAEFYASEFSFRPLLWQTCAATARVLDSLGRSSEADTKRTQARSVISSIADRLQNPEFQRLYREHINHLLM